MASFLNVKKFNASERTVVVSGLPFNDFNDKVLASLVKNYFQHIVNGGIIEDVIYPTRTKGVAYIIFRENKVAENIRRKRLYQAKTMGAAQLTVTHISEKVFSCVRAVLDLSVFLSHGQLKSLVMKLTQKIPTLTLGPLESNGRLSVKGSFLSFKMLTEFLFLEANSLVEKKRKLFKEKKMYNRQRTQRPLRESSCLLPTSGLNLSRCGETLVLDSDVFLYLKNKCKVYEDALKKFHVRCQERVDGEITTIHLKNADEGTWPNKEKQVKKLLERFSQELQFKLRKETFILAGKENSEKRSILRACRQTRSKYLQVLTRFSDTHIDIIGTSSDTYLFKTEVKELIKQKFRPQNLSRVNDHSER